VSKGGSEGRKEGRMEGRRNEKRPISVSKETYISVKRDLYQCQKRPISVRDGKREGRKEGEMGGQ